MATTSTHGSGDFGPASEMQEKYGWYAENRPIFRIDPREVPLSLHDMIPYAEKFAVRCDVTRSDFYDKLPKKELAEFARVIDARRPEIEEWLDSHGPYSDARTHFLYLMKAHCDASLWYGSDWYHELA